MYRAIKTLGLTALVAVAVGAAGARAQAHDAQLTLEESPATIKGTSIETHSFVRAGRSVTCATANFTGGASDGATTLSLTPVYEECHATILGSMLPATVTSNGCYYVLHFTEDTEPATYTADTDIECPGENQIEMHVYSSHTNHTAGTSACTFTIPPQSGLESIDLTPNVDVPDYVIAYFDLEGILSAADGSTLLCGASSDHTGTLAGSIKMEAFNSYTEARGLTVSTET